MPKTVEANNSKNDLRADPSPTISQDEESEESKWESTTIPGPVSLENCVISSSLVRFYRIDNEIITTNARVYVNVCVCVCVFVHVNGYHGSILIPYSCNFCRSILLTKNRFVDNQGGLDNPSFD